MMRKKKRLSAISIDEDPASRDVLKSKKSKSAGRPAKSLSASVPDSVFGHMLQESGINLKQGNMANEIVVDQAVFQKRLQQHLRKNPRYPNIIQEFISGLESHIEDPERFRNCLLPCVPRCADEGDTSSSSFQESLVRMLLGDLGSKLMQLVSVAPIEIQRDIITSLPEILEDSQHGDMARELKSSSVQTCSNKDSVALVLEVIKSAVRFQKIISEAWLKAIECVTEPEDHKVIDVLVLLILHSTNANQSRRGAERALKAKVRGGLIPEALLNKTFRDYAEVMRVYFPSILSLAQVLLRSTDFCVVPFGGHIYKQAFTAFDSYCQQEVVGSLVTHVCSGVSGEVDVALELLCGLVAQKPTEMAQYAVFVKGILDYMDNLSPQQIRRLFHVLSCLAFGQDQHGSHIQDDMHIVIRKQLSSTVPKYKRIGIIGAVMMVGSMAAQRDRSESSQGGTLPKDTHRQVSRTANVCVFSIRIRNRSLIVTALLELVRSCSEGSAEAAALYYDELANLLQNHRLDPLVQVVLCPSIQLNMRNPLVWIGKSVLEDFQEDFVVDLGPEIPGSFPFTPSAMYNLDEDESQGGIAVNLLPIMAKDLRKADSNRNSVRHVSPLCLSSFFRLLRLCEEKQHQGDLEEIDALLGCPLILTDMEVVEKVESLSKAEREFLCSLLFYAINWFREVVNAFCKLKDPEMKMKVVTRLQNITYLQTLLEKCLAASPGFIPPLANFDCESTEVLAPAPSVAPAKKPRKGAVCFQSPQGRRGKRRPESPEKVVKAGVSLSSYWMYFRELDMEVLNVLQCGLLSRSILDTELHSKVRDEVQLGPAELVFLLEDMWRKLDFSLAAAPAKKAPFFKAKADRTVGFSHLQQKSSKDVATCCVELLATLCTHLENCHNHFQTLLSENQGVVDALGVDINVQQLMCSAYQLLWQVLHTTFSWSGFSQSEQRPLLKNALGVLASRLKEKDVDQTLEQLINIYLGHADDVLKAVEEITEKGISELIDAAKDGSSHSWRTLNRQTFLVYYKALMAELEKYIRKIPPGKQTDSREVQSKKLLLWNLAVRDFHILVNMVKVFDSRPVLNVCLKYGRLFLESFLKLGMPLLDYSFKKHKEDVQSLLKTIQLSTRQLHHMCGHSKIRQDTALTNHVPALKKHLEQFVYRVKAMLTLNQCQEAFWLGNLKNRDLKGEEILSQRSQESENEDEESSQVHEGNDDEESDAEVKDNGPEEEEEEEDSDVSD
ncbi:Fanconi anemia group D2 protein [Bagarius yarrelli]|uniref:Fanconi anemia group D2 protein n=1 Tax=Bagarius yarrelli TaxID=175774 RepID=A0A556VY25_BAGYA|nr:Fanconi anemia group D2 protein [Bagarius yarrelli]